jgi:hypothetical protein
MIPYREMAIWGKNLKMAVVINDETTPIITSLFNVFN